MKTKILLWWIGKNFNQIFICLFLIFFYGANLPFNLLNFYTMTNYDYYLEGYNNTAYQMGYIPEFNGIETVKAYSMGSIDGREGTKKDLETFEAIKL